MIGDELEVRGPIGGFFVWKGDTPALLLGGGSGVVPLMAMLRLARKTGQADLVQLVVSVRSPDDLLLRRRARRARDDRRVHARTPPGHARGPGPPHRATTSRRSSPPTLTAYVCGSSGFADAASHSLVDLGVPVHQVRVERFGPTVVSGPIGRPVGAGVAER